MSQEAFSATSIQISTQSVVNCEKLCCIEWPRKQIWYYVEPFFIYEKDWGGRYWKHLVKKLEGEGEKNLKIWMATFAYFYIVILWGWGHKINLLRLRPRNWQLRYTLLCTYFTGIQYLSLNNVERTVHFTFIFPLILLTNLSVVTHSTDLIPHLPIFPLPRLIYWKQAATLRTDLKISQWPLNETVGENPPTSICFGL